MTVAYVFHHFIFMKTFSESLGHVDGDGDIRKEITPIRIKMFHLKLKMIKQDKNFVVI